MPGYCRRRIRRHRGPLVAPPSRSAIGEYEDLALTRREVRPASEAPSTACSHRPVPARARAARACPAERDDRGRRSSDDRAHQKAGGCEPHGSPPTGGRHGRRTRPPKFIGGERKPRLRVRDTVLAGGGDTARKAAQQPLLEGQARAPLAGARGAAGCEYSVSVDPPAALLWPRATCRPPGHIRVPGRGAVRSHIRVGLRRLEGPGGRWQAQPVLSTDILVLTLPG